MDDKPEETPAATSGRGYIDIRIDAKTLRRMFNHLLNWMDKMAGELEALRAEVQNNSNVTQSAVSLLQGLKQQLDDAIATGDMSAVQALSDQLGANDVNLAAAIAANTPQQPQPAPQGGQPQGGTAQGARTGGGSPAR